jgi:hypothetical protein
MSNNYSPSTPASLNRSDSQPNSAPSVATNISSKLGDGFSQDVVFEGSLLPVIDEEDSRSPQRHGQNITGATFKENVIKNPQYTDKKNNNNNLLNVRKVVSQGKGQPTQFNSVWANKKNNDGKKSVQENAMEGICYICGCQIEKKTDEQGNETGHYPEMEHFITPGEFFMKFGTELVCNGVQNIFHKGNTELYNQIHTAGSRPGDNTLLKTRIDNANYALDEFVTEGRVNNNFNFKTREETKYGVDDNGNNVIKYDKSFFVPQIKSYMTQFAYAHHICNQIKGHMPTLQASIGIGFDENGKTIHNEYEKIFREYASILYEVITNNPEKVDRAKDTEYFDRFNDGKTSYIAAPNSNQYNREANSIKSCWGNLHEDVIRAKIVDNMLLHSRILRNLRYQCTLERLKNINYIKGFTSLLTSANAPIIFKEITESDNDNLIAIINIGEPEEEEGEGDGNLKLKSTGEEGKEEEGEEEEGEEEESQEEYLNNVEDVFKKEEEPTEYIKGVLYNILLDSNNDTSSKLHFALSNVQYDGRSIQSTMKSAANLLASRVIYKTHLYNAKCATSSTKKKARPNKSESSGTTSGSSRLKEDGSKRGGKRTKRRRGRGKSKKKVTRRKRVKRRRTVKKNRKRRRTRKR